MTFRTPRVFARALTAALVLSVSALLCSSAAQASTVLYRTDAELIGRSERVVHGRVIRQRTERPDGGTIFTVTTLALIEDLSGRDGDTVEVWELGGVHQGAFLHVGGGVEYGLGTEVLVCLERGPRGLRSLAMGFSKFDVISSGPAAGVLIRNMAGTTVVGGPAVSAERRTMSEFRALAEQVTGRKARVVRRDLKAEADTSVRITQAFTTLQDHRWLEADFGVPILWYKNTTANSPIYPVDDTPDILTALHAWTDPPSGSITLAYNGTTTQSADSGPWGGLSSSPSGVIAYEDPNNEVPSDALAIGGGSGTYGGGGTFNGRTWNRFTEGYVIFQKAAELPASFRESPDFRRVLEHEIGHSIGLGHSDMGPSNIMHASCCTPDTTPTPPALGPDDLAALEFIYPTTGTDCTYTLNPGGRTLSSNAQSDTFTVTVQNGCSWSAVPSADWITVAGQSTASGSGSVTYGVSANTGTARSAVLTVGTQGFWVSQGAGPLTISSVTPSSGPSSGGTSITIVGTNFATSGGIPAVHIGGNAAASVVVASATRLSAVTPPGAVGARTVTVTNPDGEAASRVDGFTYTCGYRLAPSSADVPVGGASGLTVSVSATAGCSWAAVADAAFITVTNGTSGTGPGIVTYSVQTLPGGLQGRVGTITIGGQTLTILQGYPPVMGLDKTVLNFGAATTGASFTNTTGSQTVRLTQSHVGNVTWTATSDTPWLTVSPSAGSGPALLSIGIQFHGSAPIGASSSGRVTFSFSGAGNNPGPLTVNLQTYQGPTGAPVGVIDTPADNASGITGSIPVTGWALDDLEVRQVRLLRDPVAGEAPFQVHIANTVFVDGARPDLLSPFPAAPRNTRGGWGYLLLTNFLPNNGNGTFTLHAYADDVDGHTTLLGSKTISVANSTATLPFGAIDTPAQGETISGTSYNNFGWVLAPNPRRADPPGGGTVIVYIDGVPVGAPFGWTSRSDLTGLFPSSVGIGTAAGVFTFNPSSFGEGVHTIAWQVTDDIGAVEGIGSRYFTVSGGVSALAAQEPSIVRTGAAALPPPVPATGSPVEEVARAVPGTTAIAGRRGFDPATPFRPLTVSEDGHTVIHGEEVDRFELKLAAGVGDKPVTYSGYLRAGEQLADLPIGSTLDETTGLFTWQPGVGFAGPYDLVFVRRESGRAPTRHEVRFVLHPKGSNRVGPQVVIDTPANDDEFGSGEQLSIGGWAVDLDDTVGTGVSTVHVWAYPVVDDRHDAPIFLGVADYGGQRADVGGVFGQRFARGGYHLVTPSLAPGTYDVAVFAWSTARNAFVPAQLARITIR